MTGERCQQPGQRDLPRRGVVVAGDLVDEAAGLGELARGEREPGKEAQPVALADLEHVLRGAVGEVEAVLDGDDLDDRARLLELLERHVRDADVVDEAVALQLGERADGLLVGDVRVGRVQLVEVDALDAQVAQRALARLAQVIGPAVARPLARAAARQAALRGDDQAVGVRIQRVVDELLAEVRPVAVGRVDEVHAERDHAAQHVEHRVAVLRRAPHAGADDAHRAEAEAMDLEVVADLQAAARGDPAHAASGASEVPRKPLRLCVPSQKGLFDEPPQRQRKIAERIGARDRLAGHVVDERDTARHLQRAVLDQQHGHVGHMRFSL